MIEKINLASLRDAILSLQSSISIVSDNSWFSKQTMAVQNALIAGVVKNFEFVFELSIKMLRRILEQEAASPTEVDSSNFRDLVRSAAEKGLIKNVEPWFEYRQMRNITSHTYNQKKALEIYVGSIPFLADAKCLLDSMEKR